MNNEIILIISLILIYGVVVFFYKTFGRSGLYVWTAIATITANIEALMLVDAFGMEMTLGNILFASTFLVTDILSEAEGKTYANKAVKIGIAVNVVFIMLTRSWFLYTPSENDWAMPFIYPVFNNTTRLLIVSIVVYAVVQVFDVWFYHFIWKKTSEKWGDSKRGLWIRNNGSTLISQLLNTVLFTVGAFVELYDMTTLVSIMISSYVIFIVTSLADTPMVYISRKMKKNREE